MQRQLQAGEAYLMKLEAASDIKIASKDKARKAFGDLMNNDKDFRSSFGFGDRIFTTKEINKMYETFNREIVNRSMPQDSVNKFYDKLKSAGYGAIQDVNDMDYSRYNAKNPLIVFDNAGGNISVKDATKMDPNGMGGAYAQELMKALGEEKIKNLLGKEGLAISGVLGGAAATSRISDPSEDERLKKR